MTIQIWFRFKIKATNQRRLHYQRWIFRFESQSCVQEGNGWLWLKPRIILQVLEIVKCFIVPILTIKWIVFSVRLKASVVLSQEYPTTPPLFSIEITCGQTVIRDSFTKVWICFESLQSNLRITASSEGICDKEERHWIRFWSCDCSGFAPQSSAFRCHCSKLIVNLEVWISLTGKSLHWCLTFTLF